MRSLWLLLHECSTICIHIWGVRDRSYPDFRESSEWKEGGMHFLGPATTFSGFLGMQRKRLPVACVRACDDGWGGAWWLPVGGKEGGHA